MKVDRQQLMIKIELYIVMKQKEIKDQRALLVEANKAEKERDKRILDFVRNYVSKNLKNPEIVGYSCGWRERLEIGVKIADNAVPDGLLKPIPENLINAINFKEESCLAEIDRAKKNLEFLLMSPDTNVDLKPGSMKDFLKYV